MAKSRNRIRKNTKRKRRQPHTKRRRQLGHGPNSSRERNNRQSNNTNAVKKALFDMPIYENGIDSGRTKTLDASKMSLVANDPFMLQDGEEFKQRAGPAYPGPDRSQFLRSSISETRNKERERDQRNKETLKMYAKMYNVESGEKVPEWIHNQLDEYLKKEGK